MPNGIGHAPTDTVGAEFPVMLALLDSLRFAFAQAQTLLREAENAGMEVSQALFELEDVNNALTKARSAIHSFHVGPVKQEVDQGLEVTNRALARGRAALDEHRFRRIVLAASTTLILALIIGLLLKIREVDRRAAAAGGANAPDRAVTHERESQEEMHV